MTSVNITKMKKYRKLEQVLVTGWYHGNSVGVNIIYYQIPLIFSPFTFYLLILSLISYCSMSLSKSMILSVIVTIQIKIAD